MLSRRGLIAGFVLLLFAQTVWAGSGFVASTRVTGDENGATIDINFNCKVANVQSEPQSRGDRLQIFFDATSICNGVSPSASQTRGRYRPARSESARLVDLEYESDTAAGPSVTLNFSESVSFKVESETIGFRVSVKVGIGGAAPIVVEDPSRALHRRVSRPPVKSQPFVINLVSYKRMPALSDIRDVRLDPGLRISVAEVDIDGDTWFRLRVGNFDSSAEARDFLAGLEQDFPGAWIDRLDESQESTELTAAVEDLMQDAEADTPLKPGDNSSSRVESLMVEARKTMIAGDRSRAIQIYTKIMQLPADPLQADAQEYLALAREKNGQLAHAKAEYQRYLSLYPDSDGAVRVRQRLNALIASERQPAADSGSGAVAKSAASDWRLQSFFSQYYRRDVNQQNEQDEVVSQSALYSDINLDARRRGARFDFSARLSAGYRNDFLDEGFGSGNETRISYAYADVADAKTGLRGRVGRQSRNTGGILGRFDGINLGYQATERVLLSGVIGKPAYSAKDGVDSARTFYGASVSYGPLFDGLELGAFAVKQTIEGIDDRQAIGAEFRYFGTRQSVWGLVDYDTLYNELGSAFLQGSWRLGSKLTLSGSVDRRHSPFLSTGNALIGQPVLTFAELKDIFREDELRQLGLDRSPLSTTYSIGASYSLSPRLQISADSSDTNIDATPDTGGVFGSPASSYRYVSTNLVASSLIREGDVTILSLRQSTSDTSDVLSISIDSRFPFSRSWRVNPRLRIDRRERAGDLDYEWIYTPGVRVQYRRGRGMRVELEAGKQYSLRDSPTVDLDRESYFINLGYQVFF